MAPVPKRKRSKEGKKPAKKKEQPWPNDWPVQREDPFEDGGLDQPFLPTGKALVACSGSDIHLAKAATNSQKQCLAILPGLLSLPKTSKTTTDKTAAAKSEGSTVDDDGNDTADDGDDDKTGETPKEQAKDKTPAPAASTKLNELGGIIGLESKNPSLSLGNLQFQGQRVSTSSKFLVLTLQPNKKRVVCKHIFDSVILFGQGQLETKGEDTPVATTTTDIHHYGGSSRMDSTPGEKVEYICGDSLPKTPVTKPKPVAEMDGESDSDDSSTSDSPVVELDEDDEDDFKMKNFSQDALEPRRLSSRRKQKKSVKYSEVESDQEDSSSSEDDEDVGDKKQSAKKRAPRRSTSPAVTQSRDSLEESDDEEMILAAPPKEKAVRKRTKSVTRPKSTKPSRKSKSDISSESESDYCGDDDDLEVDDVEEALKKAKLPVKRKSKTPVKEVIELQSDDDDDGAKSSGEKKKKLPRGTKKGSTKSRTPAKKEPTPTRKNSKPSRGENDSPSGSEEDYHDEPKPAPTGLKRNTRRRQTKNKPVIEIESDKEEKAVSVNGDGSSRRKRKSPTGPIELDSSDATSEEKQSRKAPLDEKSTPTTKKPKRDNEKSVKSSIVVDSPRVSRSGGRRRRRRDSPATKSPAKRRLSDLGDDKEFAFLSED